MSKFYTQSGSLRLVVDSESPSMAAVAAVDNLLNPHVWIYEDATLRDEVRRDLLMVEALCHLDAVIRLSEIGFDREDAMILGTPEVIDEWHLVMKRLSGLYQAAGLPPRGLTSKDAGVSPALAS